MSNQHAIERMDTAPPAPTMFDVVAKRDYDAMVEMYAMNAQNAIVSYLAMRSRWKSSSSLMDEEAKSGELIISTRRILRSDVLFRPPMSQGGDTMIIMPET